MRLDVAVIGAQLRAPMVASHGDVTRRTLVRVTVADPASGLVGDGEAAPLESYDGVAVDEVLAALEDCRAVLAGAAPATPREELLRACASVAVLPQAIAAIDLALWDLEGRRRRTPVWRLLAGPRAEPTPIEVNATIAAPDRAGAAARAAAAARAGFNTVKLKVGIGDDAGRVAAVRAAAGPDMRIRVDANGAWEPEEAIAVLRALAPAEIDACEEPCHGLEGIERVAAESLVPIAIDESARLPGALDRRHCDAVCLKISSCGGLTGLLAAARRARAVRATRSTWRRRSTARSGSPPRSTPPPRWCPTAHRGLATLSLFEAADPIPARDGTIAIPDGPGLGDGLLEWYAG